MKDYQRRVYEDAKLAYVALMKFYPLTVEDLPDEVWLPISDYELYHVSNFGRVKSFKYKTPRILKPLFFFSGYLQVNLCRNGKSKSSLVHRLVAKLFVENPEGKPEVNHKDGHPLNCHFSNLEWVTRSENNQHAYDIGLKKSGEDHSNAKLTNEQVKYIRENPDRLNTYELADLFNISHATIINIQLGKSWKHVGGIIREKRGFPESFKAQIRADYKAGVYRCGSHALAKKYGVSQQTILRIVREGHSVS